MNAAPGRGTRAVRPRVVVIGAGLTGLATAWHLRDEVDVVVLEAGDRAGGQIRTEQVAGVPMDVGADAMLARQPEAEALARAAGFGDDDLVAPVASQVHLWTRGRLRPLPQGTVLGAPADLRALATARVLTPAGMARAALEPVLPRRQVAGDRSVADLVGERFGREVVEVLVEPLLGGVYAGDADRLSAAAAAPPVWQAAQEDRSLLRALWRHRGRAADDPRPVFLTLVGGLGRLVERLADDLGDRLRLCTPVTSLRRRSAAGASADPAPASSRWQVVTMDGVRYDADHVVVAVPAAPAAVLLHEVAPEVSRELAGIRTASVGVVALAYTLGDARDVLPGSGVLVPRTEGRLVKAITMASGKWPHHAGRDDWFLLRASVGRVDDRTALELDEGDLVRRVDAEVRHALGLRAPARHHHVARWDDALPQYDVGHLQRVDRIRAALLRSDAAGLHVGGAALDGVGLAARARDARRLADAIGAIEADRPPAGAPVSR